MSVTINAFRNTLTVSKLKINGCLLRFYDSLVIRWVLIDNSKYLKLEECFKILDGALSSQIQDTTFPYFRVEPEITQHTLIPKNFGR